MSTRNLLKIRKLFLFILFFITPFYTHLFANTNNIITSDRFFFFLIIGLLVIIGVLTIYNQKLKRLHNKEEKYKKIIDRLPGFAYLCEYNQNWTMKSLSTGFEKLTGYKKEDILEDSIISYADMILQEDREMVWDNIKLELETLEQFELEYRIVTKSNEIKWVWEQGVAIRDNNGAIKQLIGIILDVNSKKQTEQKLVLSEYHYRNLFEEAEVSIWNEDFSLLIEKLDELKKTGKVKDPKSYFYENAEVTLDLLESLKIVDVNHATLKMFNAGSKKELMDNLAKTFTKGSFDIFIKELCAIWNNEEFFYQETPFKTLDGKDIYGIISFKIPKDKEHFKAIPISMVEITELKKVQEELLQKDEVMLIQSRHAAMGEMISMIAHQWRQPLTIIAMNSNNILADLELDAIDNEVLKTNAMNSIAQTQELSNTIDDFKNFFKPVKASSEVSIQEVFEETMNIMGKSLENNNIDVSLEIDNNIKIKTYSRELMQVFMNLLNNAKDVMIEREIKEELRVVTISVEQQENGIIIKIKDNGGGIDSEILPRIFEPYFSTKSAKNGTGLGLYMSKTIVEKHLNGTIKAYNQDDGACFEIKIGSLSS